MCQILNALLYQIYTLHDTYAYVQSGGFPFPIRLNQEKNKAEPFASEAEMNDFVQATGADMMRRFDEEEARHGAR